MTRSNLTVHDLSVQPMYIIHSIWLLRIRFIKNPSRIINLYQKVKYDLRPSMVPFIYDRKVFKKTKNHRKNKIAFYIMIEPFNLIVIMKQYPL